MAEQKNQDLNQLLKIRRDKLAELQANGKDPFQITKFNQTHHSLEVKNLYEAHEAELLKDRTEPDVTGLDEEQAKEVQKNDYEERRSIMDASPLHVAIAGRMMFKRVMGKASFCNIQDLQGNIQVYVARDAIGADSYADFKKSDIGDIFGLEGFAFRTRTGEISIHAEKMTLLSKSLQILPEKFHGLTDTDMRYRQRYVDLIMNQESKNVFIKRSQVIKEIRNFLAGRDFMEVETPMLVSNAGGAAARPFETHYNALNEDVKLRISLELYLKRLIVGGLERVYEIGRVFRNEGVDTRHNPEFTLMELYQAYTDYEGMMELTESMFRYLAEKVCGSTKISYNGIEIDLGKPFERLTMNDAIKKYAGIDFDQVADDEAAKKLAAEHHIEYEERHKKGDIINLFFEEYCEKELIQPTFIMDHPIEISPLTKKKPSDPNKVERFELFINTWEMCNAYSELNDPIDQRERFKAQDALADAGDEEANHTDEDFLNALEIGMPPTGGIDVYKRQGVCSIIRKDKARCENKKRGFFRKEWFSWQLVEKTQKEDVYKRQGKDSVDLIRDSLFSIQVEQPWLLLQFGNSNAEEIGTDRVEALVSASPEDEDGKTREEVVKTEIEDNDNNNLTIPQVVNRLGMVFFLLFFNLGITIFVFLLTGMMLFSQILFIIFAMFLPISFLLSMIPSYESMAKQAIVRVFNTIMTRAGITLIVTVAFSISSMFYNISTDYPFFMVAFLQIVCFAGIYMKLGDLMSMFSLNANDRQSMGRRIFRRPYLFMRHRARRMEHRIARAVSYTHLKNLFEKTTKAICSGLKESIGIIKFKIGDLEMASRCV